MKKKRSRQLHWHFGELLDEYYGFIMLDQVPDMYLPGNDLANITSLLNDKFGRNLSFQTVARLIKEENLKPAERNFVPMPIPKPI